MRNLKLLFVLACASILFVSCGGNVPEEPVQEEGIEMLTRGGDLDEEDEDGDINGYYPFWKCRYCLTWNNDSDIACYNCGSQKPPVPEKPTDDTEILETPATGEEFTNMGGGSDPDDPQVEPILPIMIYYAFNEYGGYALIDIKTNSNWSICFSNAVEWATFGVAYYYINPAQMPPPPPADRPVGQPVHEYSIPDYSYAQSLSGSGNFQYVLIIAPNYTSSSRGFPFSVVCGGLGEEDANYSALVTGEEEASSDPVTGVEPASGNFLITQDPIAWLNM